MDDMLLIILAYVFLWVFLLIASIYAVYKLTEGGKHV